MQHTNAKMELILGNSFDHTPSALAKEAFFYVQSIGHFYANENYYTERLTIKCQVLK